MRPAALALLTVALTYGQPAFDAASVRIHQGGSGEETRNGPWLQTTPGGVTMRNAKLVWCLAWAYDQKDWLISGPDWLTSERYDIFAKASGALPTAQLKLMTRALLTGRFNLALHHETREFPVQVLVLGKGGPKNLEPKVASGPPDGPRPVGGKQFRALAFQNVSMADFAARLSGPAPFGIGEPVVDGTGLAGVFDITLNLDMEHFTGGQDEFAGFLKSALEEHAGLKLERRRMPLDTLVVDSGNKVPAEN